MSGRNNNSILSFGGGSSYGIDPDYLANPGFGSGVGRISASPLDPGIPGQRLTATDGYMPGGPGWFGIDGLGLNMGTLKMGGDLIGSIGQFYNSFQANGLARDQYKTAKQFATTNMTNSVNAYNTQLEDRARSRASVEGQNQAQVDDYIARHRAVTR